MKNATITNNKGEFMLITSDSSLNVSLSNFFFANNSALGAQINNLKNCYLTVSDSTFENNYSLSRASILQTESLNSTSHFINGTFIRNYAILGGIFHTLNRANVIAEDCYFYQNFAEYGGVLY